MTLSSSNNNSYSNVFYSVISDNNRIKEPLLINLNKLNINKVKFNFNYNLHNLNII